MMQPIFASRCAASKRVIKRRLEDNDPIGTSRQPDEEVEIA
jgi:hypothetical protein